MKENDLLILITLIFLTTSCEPVVDLAPPPIADFNKPSNIIIADKTNVQFENLSSGDIDTYFWEFEDGLNSSSEINPEYIFNYEGVRNVNLKVTGEGGSDVKASSIVVYAFDPNCSSFNNTSTHNTDRINSFRENFNVKNGEIYFVNNYNVSVDVQLYNPEPWLNGVYHSQYAYTLASGANAILSVNGSAFQYSNEWGIRVLGANGVTSCIRTVGGIGAYDGTKFDIVATDVMNGL